MENMFKTLGSWLFLIGIVVSIIVGLLVGAQVFTAETIPWWVGVLLAGLGFIVGIMSFLAIGTITQERVPTFLLAALMLIGIGSAGTYFGSVDIIGPYFEGIATMLALFVAPAAGLLAIRAIWDTGKTEEIERIIPSIPGKK